MSYLRTLAELRAREAEIEREITDVVFDNLSGDLNLVFGHRTDVRDMLFERQTIRAAIAEREREENRVWQATRPDFDGEPRPT